jgi:uncharacterized phiE125 gp8 family phage protein
MLTTLDAVKAELSIAGTDDDAALTALITQVSAAIETYCNRQFGTRTVTDTIRNRVRRDALVLSAIPVTAIDTVTESGTGLTADYYELESAKSGLLLRLDGSDNVSCWPAAKITIEYTAGYVLPGEDGANLPADIERACIDMCVRGYHSTGRDLALKSEEVPGVIKQAWSTEALAAQGAMPSDIAARLDPHRQVAL